MALFEPSTTEIKPAILVPTFTKKTGKNAETKEMYIISYLYH
jgi:hypothetical protein